jgi:hypothetical protein
MQLTQLDWIIRMKNKLDITTELLQKPLHDTSNTDEVFLGCSRRLYIAIEISEKI